MAADSASDTDEALLKRFTRGDRASLEQLARRLEPQLIGAATGLFNGRSDLAMDAVQETWLRVIRYAPRFRGRCSVRTWVYRILVNRCSTMRGRLARRPATMSEHAAEIATAEPDEIRSMRAAVATLAEPRRTALLLCYHAGLSHSQVAEILRIPLGTLKSRLHSALDELRSKLKESSS